MTEERKDTVVSFREEVLSGSRSVLDELVREGARRMLQEALELEVEEFIERHREKRGKIGKVRNLLKKLVGTGRFELPTP